jgi:hypothetical protein
MAKGLLYGYEHKSQPLASKKVFLNCVYRNLLLAAFIMGICLFIGVIGYRYGGPMIG